MSNRRFIWRGSVEDEVNSGVFDSRAIAKNLMIVNRTNGPIVINLLIRTTNEGDLWVAPVNMTIAKGDAFWSWNLHIEDRDEIIIKTTGRADYYFSFGSPEFGDINR